MSKAQDILLMAVVALYALLTATRLLTTCAQLLQTKPRRTAVARESYRFSSKGKVVSGLAQWRARSGM
ncbi:MAG TPA: hypothetical protein VJ715_17535 [Pyrinomonadaceae bacterium]|nr:hypothetical protein [Pyrinomonadaceae bacterium]